MRGSEHGEPLWRRFSIEIGAVVLLGLLLTFVGIFLDNRHLMENALLERARAQFETLVLSRAWNASHGGVFVEKRPGMKSNPYLPHPDIRTEEGVVYTRKNPALMTREIAELAAAKGGARYHITSLKPINPDNAADPFERKALLSFEKGAKEATETVTENGKTLFRYMAPLRVEKPCLKCHAAQGYKLGDIRGGISVSFDMSPFKVQVERSGFITGVLFVAAVLLMLTIVFHRLGWLQRQLTHSNQRWKFALEGAGDGVWDWNVETGKVQFSRRWKSMLGFGDDEIGDTVDEWERRVHPDDIGRCLDALERHLRGETPHYETEHRMLCKDGAYIWVLDRGKVVERAEDGRPLRAIGTHTDITRLKTVEEALRESEAQLRAVFDNTPICLNLKDREGRYLLVNPPYEEWLGYPAAEIIGKTAAEFLPPTEEVANLDAAERKVLETGEPFVREVHVPRDGAYYDRILIKFPIKTADGTVSGIGTVAIDNTERKRAEEALRESEAWLRAVFDNTPVCLNLKDREGRYLLVNRPDAEWLGRPADEIIGKMAADLIEGGGEAADIAATERRVLETGRPVVREFQVTRRGERRDRFVIKYPVAMEGGTIRGVGTVAIDNTERKRAEEALRQSEERFAKAFRASPVAMSIAGVDDGMLFDVNERWMELSGYGRDEAIGRTAVDLGHWVDLGRRSVFIERLRRDGRVRDFEAMFRSKEGGERMVLASGEIIEIAGESRLLLVFNDITERVRTEAALRESERRFRSLVEGSIQGISVNREGKLLFVNPSFAAIFGYDSPQEVLDLPAIDVLFAPHERERLRGYREVRLAGGSAPPVYEYEGVRKDGTMIRLDNLTTVVTWDGLPAILSAVVDITEKQALANQLAHSQKMEVIGQLAGGTAHDFNNLLQVIQSNLELTRLATTDEETVAQFLDAATYAVRRGATLSQQLLSFSRQQTLNPAVVDPNGLIDGTVQLLRRLLGEDIEMITELQGGVAAVFVDPHGLESALLNLALNARAAMPKGGALTIRTAGNRIDEGIVTEDGVLPAGDYVEIAVSDTGCGMPPEVMARAFEPFFTTKAVGEGSGLGLSMVYGFTLQSNGHVDLASEPGKGTTVRMMFPVVAVAEAEAAGETVSDSAVEASGATILVVEDDPDVRRSVTMVLDTLGYGVREADRAEAALEVLDGDVGIDLLFSDVVMPGGMSGFDLAAEAVRRCPGIKVLLTSGYPEKALEKVGLGEGQFSVLGKPYSAPELQAAIRAALAS